MPVASIDQYPQLTHSTYSEICRERECFIFQHKLVKVFAGTLTIKTTDGLLEVSAGDIILLGRHQLLQMVCYPDSTGGFRSTSVYFDDSLLQAFATEQQISTVLSIPESKIITLGANPMYDNYFGSLSAYDDSEANRALTSFKVKEALMLMSFLDKHTGDILFDFSSPLKTDILPFMDSHFRFNVGMNRFAFLTGRSLATFKRDFIKNHQTTPGKWLLERRLQEAHRILKERKGKVTQVYLETGFEDLSHFSFAFKKRFGKAPSKV